MSYQEGELVLCTVEKIEGTNVFVKTDTGIEGSISFSEIAPGRIRNIRDYVVPKKKIVCKILRISQRNIEFSFRRVTPKEKKEHLESFSQEKSSESILRSVLKDKAEEIISKVKEKESLSEFLENCKKNPTEIEKLAGKENAKRILEIINTQKEKKVSVKKEISLTSEASDGITKIKNLLANYKGVEIKYLAAGRYMIKAEDTDIKKADNKVSLVIAEIEKSAKKHGVNFK